MSNQISTNDYRTKVSAFDDLEYEDAVKRANAANVVKIERRDIAGSYGGVKDCNIERSLTDGIAKCDIISRQVAEEQRLWVKSTWVTDLSHRDKHRHLWDTKRSCSGRWTAVCHFELADLP